MRTQDIARFVHACASFELVQISSQVSFNLRKCASCLNTKHKSIKVFGIQIKHGGLG